MSIRVLIPALSVAFFSLSAAAADPANDAPHREGKGPQPVVLAEANEKILTQAVELDANGDGRIDAAEFAAAREKRQHARMEKHLDRSDADGDGSVSVEEFVATRQARLAVLDTDGDGIVSPEEFRQGGKHGHRHGPRPERGEKPATR